MIAASAHPRHLLGLELESPQKIFWVYSTKPNDHSKPKPLISKKKMHEFYSDDLGSELKLTLKGLI